MALTRILFCCVLPLFALSLRARTPAAVPISVTLVLPLRNPAALEDLLGRLSTAMPLPTAIT